MRIAMKADTSYASIGPLKSSSTRLLVSNRRKQWPWAERPGYRMILNASDTGDIFGRNTQRPAFFLRSDDAPQMDDAVRDHNFRFATIYTSLLAQLG